MPVAMQNNTGTTLMDLIRRVMLGAGQNFDAANAQMYQPVLDAIRGGEPDADQYGGPSDTDADNAMIGGIAGRMGGGDFGRLGRGVGYMGEAPTSGPYAGLSGRAPAPQMQRPGGTPIPPSPPMDIVRVGPSAMVGPPPQPAAPRPAIPLGPGTSMVPGRSAAMSPASTGPAPMTRMGGAPLGRPIAPMGPFGPFPQRVDVTPPPPRTGGGLPPGTFAGAGAAMLAPLAVEALSRAGTKLYDAYKASQAPEGPMASDATYQTRPRSEGQYSSMPVVTPPRTPPMVATRNATGLEPALRAMPDPSALTPMSASPATPLRAMYGQTNGGGGAQADLTGAASQLGMTGRASLADDVIAAMLGGADGGIDELEALQRAAAMRRRSTGGGV